MRYGKIMVCLFTAAFLAVAVFFGSREPKQEELLPISVSVSAEAGTQEIRCWKAETGAYYFFLPSFAQLSQTRLRIAGTGNLRMDGLTLKDGMTCEGFQWDVPYDLTLTRKGAVSHYQVTFVRSANVPALYVNVRSGSMEYINQEKGNQEAGSLRLYTAEGQLDYAGNLEALSGRGNSTWNAAKKPYNLTLSQKGDLLGMGAAQRWILLANAYDPSQLRNKLVYDAAQRLDLAYSPECEWVDLYLNGEYAGLYLLCERNEVAPERVDLSGEDSFLVSKEWGWRLEQQGKPYVTTQGGASLRIQYASLDESAILQLWQSAENAILAEDGIDPVTGKHWQDLIDTESWVRKYLVEEVFANIDGATLSQFFYYDGGKIYAGPVWDFDLAIANTFAFPCPAANMFFANIPGMWESPWYHALYSTGEFYDWVTQLYEREFRPLLTELLETGIDAYTARIAQAAAMNQLRWSAQDAAAETEYIRTYLTERMAFLDSIWIDGEAYMTVLVKNAEGFTFRYALRSGESLPQLPEAENGWYAEATGEPFDPAQPIYQDTVIVMAAAPAQAASSEDEAVVEEPAAEESESKLWLVPILVFLGILTAACFADAIRGKGQKNERTNSKIPS